HRDNVSALAISPYGRWLVSGGLDCRVFVWSLASGTCIHALHSSSPVTSVEWPAGTNEYRFLVGCAKGTLVSAIIRKNSFDTYSVDAHSFPLEHITSSINEGLIASAAQEEVRVWTVNDNKGVSDACGYARV
ncbi:WD40-repeat-containing domain protein, partial [Amylostereum chailletii]